MILLFNQLLVPTKLKKKTEVTWTSDSTPNFYLDILRQILHGYEMSTRAGQAEATNSSTDIKATLGQEGALWETHHLKPRTRSAGQGPQGLEGECVLM